MDDMGIFLSGEYFVGDLGCVFLRNFEKEPDVIDDDMEYNPDITNIRENLFYVENQLNPTKDGGVFKVDDVSFYWYKSKNGKSLYQDNFGRNYPCDSGILICFPTSKLNDDERQILMNASGDCCNIFRFQNNFPCFHNNGKVTFNDIIIDTNNSF